MALIAKPKYKKIIWLIIAAIATAGLILMLVSTYALDDGEFRHIRDNEVIGKQWYEKVILPFYFTFISNVMGFIVATSRSFYVIKNVKLRKRLELFTVVNLFVTFLVYWTLLLPLHVPEGPIDWILNMIVHLVTPLLIIFMFFVEYFKVYDENDFKPVKTSLIHLIFPIVWLTIASIVYYSLSNDPGAAVYSFLDFNNKKIYMSFIYVTGIGVLYFFTTYVFVKIGNKKYEEVK